MRIAKVPDITEQNKNDLQWDRIVLMLHQRIILKWFNSNTS
jgi:hypothetical protein